MFWFNVLDTDHDPCKDYEKNCEYTCSNVTGSVQCMCPMGYSLSVNGISCKGEYVYK